MTLGPALQFEREEQVGQLAVGIATPGVIAAGGIAIAFCDPSERPLLKDIERLVRAPLTVVGHAPLPAEAPHAEQPKRVLDYANRKKPNNRRRFRGNKQKKAA